MTNISIKQKLQNLIECINAKYNVNYTDLTTAIKYVIENGNMEVLYAFVADFTGQHPLRTQFTDWNGRIFNKGKYQSVEDVTCIDNVAHFKCSYDSVRGMWNEQIINTSGIFESDNFVCEFDAMFDGTAGAWGNVITYGTGCQWSNSLYSDGIKWPASGEIDFFEQAGGYSDNPNAFITPTAHFGAGTESGYPNTAMNDVGNVVTFTPNQWHHFKFSLKNGIAKTYIDNSLVGTKDFSNHAVSNNYLYNYKPFLRPQAFYIDGQCARDNVKTPTDHVFDFAVKNFKISTNNKIVNCTGLTISPQMWGKGTNLIFPVGAEIYMLTEFEPLDVSNKACSWESSQPNVATVCQGYVKTLNTGSTTITAKCGTVSASYIVNVSNTSNVPCVGFELTLNKFLCNDGDSIDFADKFYKFPKFATDEVTVASDRITDVVTGTSIIFSGSGDRTITVSCGEKRKTLIVTVTSSAATLLFEHNFDTAKPNVSKSTDTISFISGGTYSINYEIGKFLGYNGSGTRPVVTSLQRVDTDNINTVPSIVFKQDKSIVFNNNAFPATYGFKEGDNLTIVVNLSGSYYKAGIYHNGNIIKNMDIYEKSFPLVERRAFQSLFNDSVELCCSKISIYDKDVHEKYIK